MFDCYVINLDRCPERWERITKVFTPVGVNLIRVSAIDVGKESEYTRLPLYSERWHRFLNNRSATKGEQGCYFSHLKAMRQFLDSGAPYAVICEDDVIPDANLSKILTAAAQYSGRWDLLRLARCRERSFYPLATLPTGNELGICITGFAYAAAYMLNRHAAEVVLKKIAVMKNPYDLALHAGWIGVSEMSLIPGAFTMDDSSQESTIGGGRTTQSPLSPLWYSALSYKILTRLWRYSLQYYRVAMARMFSIQSNQEGGLNQ